MESTTAQEKKARIIVDTRELNGGVPKALDMFCPMVDFEVQTLDVGDYVLSDRTAAERKTAEDFWDTFFERKELFSQLRDLAKSYERPLLILEGENFYSRNVNPNVIRGIVSTICVDMRLPMIHTVNQLDTAQYLARIAMREQVEESRSLSVHGKRSHMSEDEQREYIVSAICNIGPTLSKALLEHFGDVENVMKATEIELRHVKKVGPKTAADIRRIVAGRYGKHE